MSYLKSPMWTPWGWVDQDGIERLTDGIEWVSTPSHSGLHLDSVHNQRVPAYMRREDGWYEEDCDWAIAAVTFPEFFPHPDEAKRCLKTWHPQEYERFFGCTLQPGESHVKDGAAFLAAHAADWVVISASGDWHEGVPTGMVGVTATRGGTRVVGAEEAQFLVPQAEYHGRSPFGFVVDPAHHPQVMWDAQMPPAVAGKGRKEVTVQEIVSLMQ